MNTKLDSNGILLPDKNRITRFGKVLRATSLDELPEMINILKGDMSFVGPRPLLTQYLELYTEEQKKRHNVRPGLTGLAQVNGRNSISWSEKFKHDVYYVENISLFLDIKILFITVLKVFKKEGINFDKSGDVKEFNGSN